MKLAILQNGDEPQVRSTAAMMAAAGYEVRTCGPEILAALRAAGCDSLYSTAHMEALGYDRCEGIQQAGMADLLTCDLFMEIKVRNVAKIVAKWPRLRGRIAWLRVNGSQPEICEKGGDEVNLPCPVITACMWYGTERYRGKVNNLCPLSFQHLPHDACDGFPLSDRQKQAEQEHLASNAARDPGPVTLGDNGMAYVCWPPYPRSAEYDRVNRERIRKANGNNTPPYCLAHSAPAWGYGQIVQQCVEMGIRVFGNNAPHGQVSHREVVGITERALCLVHLKSVDCPGWALYEAILAGCPVVTGRLLNSRMLAGALLEHGETCLEFGVPASLDYGRGDMDFPKCLANIKEALERLRDPAENIRVGENGRRRLNELLWTAGKDGPGFKAFMERHFG